MSLPKRENHRYIEPRKDSEGILLCLVPNCNNRRAERRNYCHDHGWQDMEPFTSWPALRMKALKRDEFRCIECGDNRQEIKLKRVGYYGGEYYETKTNFIVDHIKPIAMGGDEWDMENLQTLCQRCNKIKTRADMKDIALERKRDKLRELGQREL